MAKVIGVRADDGIVEAVDQFARECGISRAQAVSILLSKGLGIARMAEVKPITVAGGNRDQRGDGVGEDMLELLNVEGAAAASAVIAAPSPAQGVAAPQPDDDFYIHADELIARHCWGFYEQETSILTAYPGWVLAAPPEQLRGRFARIIADMERLGIGRTTPRSVAYIGARLGGLTARECEDVIVRLAGS